MSDDTRSVPPRTLGKTGPVVAAVALGCSSMSGLTGAGADDEVAAGTIRAAIDQGVDLIDTADFYGLGHNESLIARALTGVPRDRYLLSDKFGGLRDPSGAFLGTDCRPATLKTVRSIKGDLARSSSATATAGLAWVHAADRIRWRRGGSLGSREH